MNIGSILGRRGCPHKSEYSASKFALHGFSEAVRPELARLGIDVLVVAAGPTETEHFDTLLEDKGELPWGNPRRKPAAEVARIDRPGHRARPARSRYRLARPVLDAFEPLGPAARGPHHGPLRLAGDRVFPSHRLRNRARDQY